jgi:predicted dehydrogenase
MGQRLNVDGPVRVGLAGAGRFGKLHAAVLGRLPQARLVAVCDPDEAELNAVAEAHGVPDRFTSYDEFLARADLDCLFLVTPEHLHAEMARKAIDRGLPIFLEKPLATTSAEGRRVADAAARAGVILQVGFVLRFETQHAFLKQEIDHGRFGRIVSVRVKRNCSKSWFAIYGDRAHAVHETVIHDVDLLLWFLGARCEKVYAVERHLSGRRFPDATLALLQFEGGAVATVETSWLIPDRAPANVLTDTWSGTIDAELEIVGTDQSARLRILESGLQIWSAEGTKHPEPGLWPAVHGAIAGALREEDAHFVDSVRTGTPSTVASVADAVDGLRIVEAIIASAAQGCEVVLSDGEYPPGSSDRRDGRR